MGFGGMKIDGHSGTQFKHRKAFVKQKKMQQAGLHGGERKTGYWEPKDNRLNHRFRLVVSILSALAAIVILLLGGQVVQEATFVKRQEVQHNQELYDRVKHDSYNLALSEYGNVISYAEIRYEQGRYASAKHWYERALVLFPYDWEANLGLTTSLVAICAESGELCENAQQYLLFCYTLPERKVTLLDQLNKDLKASRIPPLAVVKP